MVFLVPDIRNAFVEEQREDELLIVTRIDQAAQENSGPPEVAFKFLLGNSLALHLD